MSLLLLTFSHNSRARTIVVNTQFLFVNDTDVLLLLMQRGTKGSTALQPRQRAPFSFHKYGARQIQVGAGDAKALSEYLIITNPTLFLILPFQTFEYQTTVSKEASNVRFGTRL